jgi:quercetin dioxygenase-like cupin family protein
MEPQIKSFSYRDRAKFGPDRFHAEVVFSTENQKAVLACFQPGQFIPVHTPGVDLTLVVLEGEGRVVAGEQEIGVAPGQVVTIPAGIKRGVFAKTQMVALHVVSPPPSEADHQEVHTGLMKKSPR